MKSIWIARDYHWHLSAFASKPKRGKKTWIQQDHFYVCELDDDWFPFLHWEDEPIELIVKNFAVNVLDDVLDKYEDADIEECILDEFEDKLGKKKG